MKKSKLFVLGFAIILVGIGVFSANAFNTNLKLKSVALLDNNSISIKYSKSQNYDNKKFEIYVDNEENEYIYLGDKLTGFLKNVTIEEKEHSEIKKIMENKDAKSQMLETYKEKAFEIVKNVIKEKSIFDGYDITDSYYQESYGEMIYSFTKSISGYVTNDSITIALDNNGNLSSLNAPRQGIFDKYDNVKIDKNKVDEFIKASMNSKVYSDITSYSVNYELLNIVNDKLVLELGIRLVHETGGISTTILYYEI